MTSSLLLPVHRIKDNWPTMQSKTISVLPRKQKKNPYITRPNWLKDLSSSYCHHDLNNLESYKPSNQSTVYKSPSEKLGQLPLHFQSLNEDYPFKSDNRKTSRYQLLTYEWVQRLNNVMETPITFQPKCYELPVIFTTLRQFICKIQESFENENITIKDIRINGMAASYIFCDEEDECPFSDLDLVFGVDLSEASVIHRIKSCVMNVLTQLMPTESLNSFPSDIVLSKAYVQKLVRVNNKTNDHWTLLALGNQSLGDKLVELKFVHKMRRKFEFTVDSFQIILDSLLGFYKENPEAKMTKYFYPTVVAESVAGDFQEAVYHLKNRLIATRNPEEIRGGGLLKYCKLMVEGYRPANRRDLIALERYMCSRFFIDFPDLISQSTKLESYLYNHFGYNDQHKIDYLKTLLDVVCHSCVCLMNYDHKQILQMIKYLIQKVENEKHIKQSVIELEIFSTNDWALDQVFYGTSYFPQEAYVAYALPNMVDQTVNLRGKTFEDCKQYDEEEGSLYYGKKIDWGELTDDK